MATIPSRRILWFLGFALSLLIIVFVIPKKENQTGTETFSDRSTSGLQDVDKKPATKSNSDDKTASLDSETAIAEQFERDLAHGVKFALESLKDRNFDKYSARIASEGIAEKLMESGMIEFFDALSLVAEIFGKDDFEFLTIHLSSQLLRNHSFDQDPKAVSEFLATQPNRAIFQFSAQDAGIGLVKDKENPLEVVKIIEKIPNLEDNSLLLKGALKQFLTDDIEGFTNYLSEAKTWTDAHDQAVYAIYTNFTTEDPSSVIQWLHLIQDEELRDKATYGTAINLARESPELFQEWIAQLPDSTVKTEILDSL